MTITQIRYFIESATSGSFQKASEKLFISHQALNKQIRALEAEIGLPLFERSGKKGLRMTEAGETLYSAWTKVLPIHDAALSKAAALKAQSDCAITVGIQDIRQLRYGCLDLFQQYSLTYPQSRFDYKVGTPDQVLSMLENNQIDMAIILSLSLDHAEKYSHLILREFDDKPVIAISKLNPLSQRNSISLADLADENFVMIDDTHSKVVARRQQRDFAVHGVFPKVITVSSPKELELALAMNRGVSIVHQMLLTEIEDKVTVFPFEPAEENRTYSSVLLWSNPKMKEIAGCLQKIGQTFP